MPGKLLVRPLELAILMIAKHKIIFKLEQKKKIWIVIIILDSFKQVKLYIFN